MSKEKKEEAQPSEVVEPEQEESSEQVEPVEKQEETPSVEERNKILEEENKKLKEDNKNYATAVKTLKGDKKREKIQVAPTQESVQDDDESDSDKEEKKIEKVLDKRDAETQQENFDKAVKKFHEKYPQYDPENDFGDVNWNKIESKIKAHSFKGSVEDMVEDIEMIHHGVTREPSPVQPDSDPEKVDDSGIGSVPGLPGGEEKKDDVMTRPLNVHEKEACKVGIDSGTYKNEEEYRKALAKRESVET